MIIIVTGTFTPTAQRLCDSIAESRECRLVSKYDPAKRIITHQGDTVLNWGAHCISTTTPCNIFNNNFSYKSTQFHEIGRLPILHPFIEKEEFDPYHLPVLVREDGNFGGRGIYFCDTVESVRCALNQNPTFPKIITKYIPKIKEYRVHICHDNIIAICYKKPNNPTDIAWNNTQGASQHPLKNETLYEVLSNLAKEIMRAIRYDYGAIDIMMDKFGRLFYLETNRAPALTSNEDRIARWIGALIDLQNSKPVREV